MAADTEPINEWVEGYNESGKLLERITRVADLQEQQKKMKSYEVELNKQLQKEQQSMGELQHQLTETNDRYAEEKQKLDELRSEQRVTLDGDQKTRIMTVTRDTVDGFVCRIPRSKEEQMTVDVHFLTGTETTGFNLQLNGEGAGSRDAKFLVKLNQKVQSLAEQAAKYWGLDANKVFFLDRDGRIVLDSMNLKDIILPPAPASASTEASAPGTGDQMATQEKDLWMVRGRNYCLTLVRASTVLSKEDLNRPKGEKWEDFTFNETELEKELERTRKKRAGEDGEAQKINMDAIPSLHELMQQGQEKKRKKRVETRCRCLELMVFILCEVCFLASIPNLSDQSGLPLIHQQTERRFTNFTTADNGSAFGSWQVASFQNIHTNEQYVQWLNGPLTRTLSTLKADRGPQQTYLIAALATLYEASPNQLDESATQQIKYCTPEPIPPNTTTSTVVTYTSTTSTMTGKKPVTTTTTVTRTATTITSTVTTTSTSVTRTETSNTITWTSTSSTTYIGESIRTVTLTRSTATSSTATRTITTTSFIPFVLTKEVIPSRGIVCVPREFEPCVNRRVMNILGKGFFLDQEVPRCKPTYKESFGDTLAAIFDVGKPFARSFGKVNTYYGGKIYANFLEDIPGTVNDFLDFRAGHALRSPDSLRGSPPHREFVGAAQTFSIALYLPTINSIFINEFVVENLLSGSLVTSIQRQMVQMDNELPLPTALMSVSMVLAVLVLFLEVRRIFGCPRVCTFEEERSHCSVWTVIMLLLVCLIPTTILIRNMTLGLASETLKGIVSDMEASKTNLWNILKLREVEMNMKTVIMFVFSMLQLKFLLMHFPQLAHMAYVVKKIVKPLLAVVLMLIVVLFSHGVMLTALYGDDVEDFSNIARTSLHSTLWSMGNIKDWHRLYNLAPESFPVLLIIGFLVVQVTLNFLPAVVMISHKKDGDLFDNYSYHNFWAIERTKQHASKDPHSTNPALIGFDFSGREPRPVERQEGWLAAAALMESKPSS
eukprot:TRINITY_DN24440_c0_g2_i1.p1 TRINITY_DN24440_c0_g2~~TRINITY_DN24440_c0_g2_i1.p1  ORF type:complete len:1002 (-),score=190.60 TRINITY_DN24440_c0_g2_i1:16-3021(-)